MSGAGNDETFVTTWGRKDVDGESWQVYRVRKYGQLVAEIVLPLEADTMEACMLAANMFDPDANYTAPWVPWPTEATP